MFGPTLVRTAARRRRPGAGPGASAVADAPLPLWTCTAETERLGPVERGVGDAILRPGTEFNYVKRGSEGG